MRRQSGDTLVEVLIATAILSVAVVGGLGMMNFGFGTILNSIERTQVQAGINSQFSLIQYARDEYVRASRDGTVTGGPAVWQAIIDNATDTYSTDVCTSAGAPATNASRNPFYIRDDGSVYEPLQFTPTPAVPTGVPTAGIGLWVEVVRPTTTTNYIDIYVKACWPPAAGVANQESRSAMRLYTGDSVAVAAVGPPGPAPVCNALEGYSTNHISNGDFSISAGSGPGVALGAGFTSDLPNRGPEVYPDDAGLNGSTAVYTGGFSLQTGEKWYGASGFPNSLHGRAFTGDVGRGVPATATWFYSNPNQRVDQPPGTITNFIGTLWRQSITTLQPNATYDFSGYFDNVLLPAQLGATDPVIQLRANGVPLMAPMTITKTPDDYQRATLIFTTGPAQTSVTLDIYDTANNINGDDFAMTALALRRCI